MTRSPSAAIADDGLLSGVGDLLGGWEPDRKPMSAHSPVVQSLIDELGRLARIGPKTGAANASISSTRRPCDAPRLAESINTAKARVSWCNRCFNLAESELCELCVDPRRDEHVLCVSSKNHVI